MKTIRSNVFETNSSSTHSLTICSGEDFAKWKNGELYYNPYDETFYTFEERENYLKEKYSEEEIIVINKDTFCNESDCDDEIDYYDWCNIPLSNEQYQRYIVREYYEEFTESSNVNGIEVVAFGYYGGDN